MTDVELIKSKIDIVDFISDYVSLKKMGRTFKSNCPFHSEKTPSFIVSPERGSWHCFGACSEGGDVISFLQKWENIEFLEALKILAKKVGVTLSNYAPSQASILKEKLYEINHLASEFYHYLLTSHKLGDKAKEYLKSREIKEQTIKTFTLGYAPDSWDSLLKFLTKKGYSQTDILTAGLSVKSAAGNFYDRFRGRLMFTLRDHRGNNVGFSGRKLPGHDTDKDLPAGRQEAKYVNTSETPVYIKGNVLYGMDVTRESIKKEKEVVVVEGEFDMLASFQSGVTNVVAIKGSALTEGQVLLLKRYSENVILALDSDFAGNEAARRGIEIAEVAGLSVRVAKLAAGKDPAECIEKGAHLWKKSIENAVPIYDFIIDSALTKYNKSDVLDKKRIGSEIVPILSKLTNPIVQSHYIKYLAKQLDVAEESIENMIAQFQKKGTMIKSETIIPTHAIREELLEEHLLTLIVQSEDVKESLSQVLSIVTPHDFKMQPVKKIIEQIDLYLKKHDKFDAKKFRLDSTELTPTFDRAYMSGIDNILSQKQVFVAELITTAKEVKRAALRRRINILSTQIKKIEDDNENSDEQFLQEKLRSLLRQVRDLDKSN